MSKIITQSQARLITDLRYALEDEINRLRMLPANVPELSLQDTLMFDAERAGMEKALTILKDLVTDYATLDEEKEADEWELRISMENANFRRK